jgi:hypothetical protein
LNKTPDRYKNCSDDGSQCGVCIYASRCENCNYNYSC